MMYTGAEGRCQVSSGKNKRLDPPRCRLPKHRPGLECPLASPEGPSSAPAGAFFEVRLPAAFRECRKLAQGKSERGLASRGQWSDVRRLCVCGDGDAGRGGLGRFRLREEVVEILHIARDPDHGNAERVGKGIRGRDTDAQRSEAARTSVDYDLLEILELAVRRVEEHADSFRECFRGLAITGERVARDDLGSIRDSHADRRRARVEKECHRYPSAANSSSITRRSFQGIRREPTAMVSSAPLPVTSTMSPGRA